MKSFVLVRAATEAGAPIPNLEDLREMKLLLLEEGHCFRDQALALCRINPALRQGFLDASSLSTLVQMVGAGVGVTLVPEMAAPVETRSANVEVVRLPPPEPGRVIGMIWRKKSAVADQMLAIHRVVREAAPGKTTSGKRRQR
jgi:LysR family hydrogen peroxide-inducible transcriptional activator